MIHDIFSLANFKKDMQQHKLKCYASRKWTQKEISPNKKLAVAVILQWKEDLKKTYQGMKKNERGAKTDFYLLKKWPDTEIAKFWCAVVGISPDILKSYVRDIMNE